ncbi:hypothetical protein C7S16_5252 [Burkholderia thailandensis]|uniref:Uncharacterized protein n=1 Tax=Burkholderia thailandensis TaxID=57975 RepID=A0AAW9CQ84_BURTH|nr:hypothetical protein AQ475_27945 [Burkholderia thailandensis]AVR27275.1 hypothetical protein A8H32_19470 [Burkholderia thailandensis]MDW9252755.1 hypothetical protein [Burkholderia thailandensis]
MTKSRGARTAARPSANVVRPPGRAEIGIPRSVSHGRPRRVPAGANGRRRARTTNAKACSASAPATAPASAASATDVAAYAPARIATALDDSTLGGCVRAAAPGRRR